MSSDMIQQLDSVLSLVSKMWLEERDPAKKRDLMNKVNGLLDERLKAMKESDAKT